MGSALLGVPKHLTRPDASETERALAQGWARVAARPNNSKFAGQKFPLAERRPDLAGKYPESVAIDAEGFPDFAPYAKATVQLNDLNYSAGNNDFASISRPTDFAEANKLSGWSEPARKEAGLTWHHHQDGRTLMLVPADLHNAIAHHGGVAHVERVEGPMALITNYVMDAVRRDNPS